MVTTQSSGVIKKCTSGICGVIKKCTISEVAFLLAFGQECRSVIFGPIGHFYDAPGNNLSEKNPHDLRLGSEKWPDYRCISFLEDCIWDHSVNHRISMVWREGMRVPENHL